MAENKKNLTWFIPLLGIIFLALIMFKRAPESLEENPYFSDEIADDDIEAAYSEIADIAVEMELLNGLAVDAKDNIFVVGDRKMLIIKPDGHEKKSVDLNDSGRCLTVSSEGKIYVGYRRHIEVFDENGKKLAKWDKIDDHSVLTSLTIASNFLFVADAGKRKVWKFDLNGKVLGEIGGQKSKDNVAKFIVPSPFFDVATAVDGSIWVVNPGRHQLENFAVDGKLKSKWGKSSPEIEGFCGCCNPTNIAIMKDGSFVTSEKGYCRIKIYNQNGKFKEVVAGESQFKRGTKGLDLAVDSTDRILVLDPKMKKIRIFRRKAE